MHPLPLLLPIALLLIAAELREQVWPLIEAGRIRPVIHTVFPAALAAQAHALMESSVHVVKIVLDWNKP